MLGFGVAALISIPAPMHKHGQLEEESVSVGAVGPPSLTAISLVLLDVTSASRPRRR